MFSYARRELVRNPRRTLASLVGVVLGVGLFSAVLFFIDGSGASMTKRAIGPVALDLQRVLTSPYGEGLRLDERATTRGPLARGDTTRVKLTVRNLGTVPANEVVVNDKLGGPLEYMRGTATRNGRRLPDVGGRSPFAQGPAQIGLNIGTVSPGAVVELSYQARARRQVVAAADLPQRGTISTRELLKPMPANAPRLLGPAELRARIARLPGVASADELAFADLPTGSLRTNRTTADGPVRVFGFDRAYARHYSSIHLAAGSFDPGGAVLSPEAARALRTGPGGRVQLILPDRGRPLEVPVSGIADLSRARPLFNSRKGLKLEEFLYTANSIVLSPDTFHKVVVPAFRHASGVRGLRVKSPPTLEVDVLIKRSLLDSDPALALRQTEAVGRAIRRIAPNQDFQLDNISNTLQVARSDAAVAKRMFLFLGLPGLLLAAFLAAYSGSILASAQRREHANLRLRGAKRGHLIRILAYRTAAVAGAGSVLGVLAGFASATVLLGPSAFFEAAPGKLIVSALVAIGCGVSVTGLALYVPGHRALSREVSGERREMALERQPAWRRRGFDYAGAAVVTIAAAIALQSGTFDTPAGSVSTGQATSLAPYLLLLPLTAWFAGSVLSVRGSGALAARLPVASPPRFGPLVTGILNRSLSRRPRALVTGSLGVGLVVAFGISLAIFAASYDAGKAADSRFTVGSDLRVTPSPLSRKVHPPGFARKLRVSGVAGVTPVVSSRENAFLRSDFNSDVKTLAAIDPLSFYRTGALSDSFFPGSTAARAMAALKANPRAVLVDEETAAGLKLRRGDTVEVLLARGTKAQRLRKMTVAGMFSRLPGFPEGVHVVANLAYYEASTHLRNADFFLARATDQNEAGLARAVSAIGAGPGRHDSLEVDTTKTTLNKDQSSLTALNIRGLVGLDSLYTLLITAAVVAIFVLGLMLQRRREYVTLRAQGMASRKLQALVLGEAAFVGLTGLASGLLVGSAMGVLLVHTLHPLFILPPSATVPAADIALIAGLVIAATLASTFAALTILRRLRPAEILREQ